MNKNEISSVLEELCGSVTENAVVEYSDGTLSGRVYNYDENSNRFTLDSGNRFYIVGRNGKMVLCDENMNELGVVSSVSAKSV